MNTELKFKYISYTHHSRIEDFDSKDAARGRQITTEAHEVMNRDKLLLRFSGGVGGPLTPRGCTP